MDYDNHRFMEAIRPQYYPDCLLVGKGWASESEMVLLNPRIISGNGEWETIFFANWVPGNRRYRSFYDWAEQYVGRMAGRLS